MGNMIDKEDFANVADLVLNEDYMTDLFAKYPDYKLIIMAVLQDISERLFD